MNTVPQKKETFEILQAFRGIAALAVLLYHIEIISRQKLGHSFQNGIYSEGHLGVEFFFVLSGFIIFYIHERDIGKSHELSKYLVKRILRVYPLILLITALKGIYMLAGAPGVPIEKFTISSVISSFLLLPSQSDLLIAVVWTLKHEMLFYIMFGGVILFGKNTGKFVLILICAGMALISLFPVSSDEYLINFLFSYYNIEFILGILAAYLWRRNKWHKAVFPLVFGVGIILLIYFFYLESQNALAGIQPIFYHMAIAPIFGMIVIGGIGTENKYSLGVPRFLREIGNGSYSIYLIHSSIQVLLFVVILKLMPSGYEINDLIMYFIALISFIGGMLCWWFVEKPMMRRTRNYIRIKYK